MTRAASRAVQPLPTLAASARTRSWARTLLDATRLVTARPSLWAVALVGFLVRGGLVVLGLPILVLPSPIQLAASFGLDAVSISGEPTTRFIQEVAVALIGLVAWLLVSAVAGAVVEVLVGQGVTRDDPDERERDASSPEDKPDGGAAMSPSTASRDGVQPRISARLVWGLVLLRLLTLVPVAVALAWGIRRVIDVGYREVTVPSDTATPLVLRIAQGAADAIAVIVVAWLVMELVLALATRHLLLDLPIGRTARRASLALVRRPVPVLAFVIGTAVSIAVLAAGVLATQAAWEAVQFQLRVDAGLDALGAVFVLVALWTLTLVAAAILSAWRSGLVTAAYVWVMEEQDAGGS